MFIGLPQCISAIRKSIGILVVMLGLSVGMAVHAKETPSVMGLVIGKSTPAQVQAQIQKLSPSSRITTTGETIRAEKVRIDGQTYNVEASFVGNPENAALYALEMTIVGQSTKRPAILSTFTANKDKRGEYTHGDMLALWTTSEGRQKITIIQNPNNPFIDRTVEVVKWIAIALCAILALFSLNYFWWWIIGGIVGYVLGNGPWGVLAGAVVASLHFLINYFQSRNLTYVIDGSGSGSGSTYDMNDPMAINPANGLPMIGGQGGIDIHGNTFGSNFNDPHHH
jgi:hypothetical protein